MANIIVGLSFLLSEKKNDLEKVSAYECGFERAPSKSFVVWTYSQSSNSLMMSCKSLNLSRKETLWGVQHVKKAVSNSRKGEL